MIKGKIKTKMNKKILYLISVVALFLVMFLIMNVSAKNNVDFNFSECQKSCSIMKKTNLSECQDTFKANIDNCRENYSECRKESKEIENRKNRISKFKDCRNEFRECMKIMQDEKITCKKNTLDEHKKCKEECKGENKTEGENKTCEHYYYSTCPSYCEKRCVPSCPACLNCDGPGSCFTNLNLDEKNESLFEDYNSTVGCNWIPNITGKIPYCIVLEDNGLYFDGEQCQHFKNCDIISNYPEGKRLLWEDECNICKKTFCTGDSDCIRASCCHPTSTINKDYAPNCKNTFCTADCSGPLDCGCGKPACINNQCDIKKLSGAGYCS